MTPLYLIGNMHKIQILQNICNYEYQKIMQTLLFKRALPSLYFTSIIL